MSDTFDQQPQQNWKKTAGIFIASQALSLFGTSLVQYAISWHIALITKSGLDMTLAIICGFLPTFFMSPFGGVWADRYNRKHLIMLADGSIAFFTLVLAILFMMGHNQIWLLFVALGLRAVGSAVQNPCVGAMLPDIVPPDQLTRVNGINGSVQSMIFLLSPMLSAALLSVAPVHAVFFVDVLTAAAAIIVMLFFLQLPKTKKTPAATTPSKGADYFGDLKKGFSYIARNPYLRAFFILMAIFNLLAAPAAFLTPLQVARTFGDDVWRLSATEISFSIGMMAGGLIIASWGGLSNRVHTMFGGSLIMSFCTIVLGIPPNFWVYLTMMSLIGLSMPFFNTPATVLLQEQVEPEYMGRIFGVLTMVSSVMMPAGMLIFGPLADIVPIEWLLILTGFGMLILSFVLLKNKALVKAGIKQNPA